ncbi:MAG: AP2 domain-containing protein [Phycisphaerae bacterium]
MHIIKLTIPIPLPNLIYRLAVRIILKYRTLRGGRSYRLIPLSQNQYAKVDPEDYEKLSKHNWNLMKFKNTQYAVRIDKGFAIIHMHREIMQPPKGMVVHHINNDGRDNRKQNLRIVTYKQNAVVNKPAAGNFSSKYKGIYWHKQRHKWVASLRHNRKKIYIGVFADEIQAAKAYDQAALKYHGPDAYLNFPDTFK